MKLVSKVQQLVTQHKSTLDPSFHQFSSIRRVQWSASITDITGAKDFVLYSEVSLAE